METNPAHNKKKREMPQENKTPTPQELMVEKIKLTCFHLAIHTTDPFEKTEAILKLANFIVDEKKAEFNRAIELVAEKVHSKYRKFVDVNYILNLKIK